MSGTRNAPPRNPMPVKWGPLHSPKYPQMRPNFASYFRYKHETNETSFRPPKPSPQLRRSPCRRRFSPLFPCPVRYEVPPNETTFSKLCRYGHETNETNLRYKKLHFSYDFGRISYKHAP